LWVSGRPGLDSETLSKTKTKTKMSFF
jgi:hypothetical protein